MTDIVGNNNFANETGRIRLAWLKQTVTNITKLWFAVLDRFATGCMGSGYSETESPAGAQPTTPGSQGMFSATTAALSVQNSVENKLGPIL